MEDNFRILLVEDDLVDARNFERVLGRINIQYSFEHLTSIEDGVNALGNNSYDIIFLDYHLPRGSSVHILRYLNQIESKTPVIIITSYANPKVAVELIQNGATDYIPKSLLTVDGLSQAIRGAVRVKELQEKKYKTEQQLRKVEGRLGTIISNTPIILFVIDSNGIIQLGIGKYWDSFSPKSYSLIGVGFREAFREYPILIGSFQNALNGNLQEVKVEINEIVFEVTFTPRVNSDGTLQEILGLALDVTDHVKGKQSLEKAKQIAENASQMKQEFIANMSHEIRTPMNAIIGFANLLSETQLDQLQGEFVDSIKISGENLLALVNDILDFSKIEAGKLEIENEDFDLKKVVKSVFDILEVKAIERKNSLTYTINENVPEWLVGDSARLYQILMNLIGNAVKFTKSGFVQLEVGINREKLTSVDLFFKVSDSGVGIPASKINDIFDSFVQVEGGINRKSGGTGLGLAIVKRLVGLMGGGVNVQSVEGEGTVFEVVLPFEISLNRGPESKSIAHQEFKSLEGKRMLLAEDNEMNQKLVIMCLRKFNVQIDLAENGTQAIKAAMVNDYDLILMDVQMPEVDGLEATREIRKLSSKKGQVPIVAMTAHAFKEEVENCFAAGMNAHISKPIDKQAFLVLISSLVHSESIEDVQYNKTVSVNPESSLVDLTYLRDMCDGNVGFINEMIRIFKTDSPELISKMKDAYQSKNYDVLSKTAHKFRSSVVMMGMKGVAKLTEKVEYYDYENKNLDQVESWLEEIEDQSIQAINYIEKNF